MPDRPSPSDHAKLHKDKTKIGNDGFKWQSKANKNGIYSWRRIKQSSLKTSTKKTKKKTTKKKTTKKKKTFASIEEAKKKKSNYKKSTLKSNKKKQWTTKELKMWKIIEEFEWTFDHSVIRVGKLLHSLSHKMQEDLSIFVFELMEESLKKYKNAGLNDKLLPHIIGECITRGKIYFEQVNKKILQDIQKHTILTDYNFEDIFE